jgi:hypothetical protein
MGHGYLADLLDDLNHEQLTSLLNYLAVGSQSVTRRNIRVWRKTNGFVVDKEKSIFESTVGDFLVRRG